MKEFYCRVFDKVSKEYMVESNFMFFNLGVPYNLSEILSRKDRFIIEQSTGYCGFGTKAVFIGDIVHDLDANLQISNGIYECYWDKLRYSFQWRSTFDTVKPLYHVVNFKLMGNINQNPQLLNKSV